MLIIGPTPFISQSSPDHCPQPRIDFSYYEMSGPDICSFICVLDLEIINENKWFLLLVSVVSGSLMRFFRFFRFMRRACQPSFFVKEHYYTLSNVQVALISKNLFQEKSCYDLSTFDIYVGTQCTTFLVRCGQI